MQPASIESWRRQKCDLRDYLLWREKDPDSILAERKANRSRDPEARLEEVGLQKYRQAMLDRGLAQGTGQKAFVSIVSFFKHNYQRLVFAQFPTLTMDQFKGAKRLKKEEIQRLYEFSDNHRDKLILLAGAESGLRVRGLQQLRLGCFVATEDRSKEGVQCQNEEDLSGATVPCRIQLPVKFYTSRRKREGITFVCQDFVKLLIEYLGLRRKLGEPINARTPIFPTYRARLRVLATGTIVTRQRDSWASPGSKVTASVTQGGMMAQMMEAEVLQIGCEPLVDEGIQGLFRRLRKRAGINYDPETERPASAHSLRKYLHSTLDASGVNSTMVNVIVGHSNQIADHYSGRRNLDVEEVRHAYESAMHRIAVTEESNGPRVLKLERRVHELESYSKSLENQISEWAPVKDQLAELREFQQQFRDWLNKHKGQSDS